MAWVGLNLTRGPLFFSFFTGEAPLFTGDNILAKAVGGKAAPAGSPYLPCHITYSRFLRIPQEFIMMWSYTEDPHG